jgi:DNA-binding phage protein
MKESTEKDGTEVPGWSEEFEARFGRVIDRAGGVIAAAEIAGVHGNQISRWRHGKARPPFPAMMALCSASGVRLDWLAFGRGEMLDEPAEAAARPPYASLPSSGGTGPDEDKKPAAAEMDRGLLLRVIAGTLGNRYSERNPYEAAGDVLRAYETALAIRTELIGQNALTDKLWNSILGLLGGPSPANLDAEVAEK